MSTGDDELKRLRALRDSINASIDAYASLTPEERSKKPKVDQARQQISKAATKLANETVVPQQQANLIAFQVRSPRRISQGRD
jgi:hypothetical protein